MRKVYCQSNNYGKFSISKFQIQKGCSVEYLIEMRQVTILFLNIVPIDLTVTKITLLANEVHRTVTK